MDTNVNLPEGFVLDKQSIQNSSNLPEGFILDEQPITQTPQLNIWGNIYTRPASALRSALYHPSHPIQEYIKGALEPTKIPTPQQVLLKKYWETLPPEQVNPLSLAVHTLGGFPVSALGYGLNIVTNPAELLTMWGTSKAIQTIAPTKVGQAIGRFFTKERKFLKFGKRAVQDIAEKVAQGQTKIFGEFNQKYENLFNEIKEGSTQIDDVTDAINTARINAFPNSGVERKMTELSDRLENFNELSANQLQSMKQEVRKILPKNVWLGQIRANPEQHFVKEVYKSINTALARIGGEKYTGLSQEYKDFSNMIDEINSVILQRGKPTDIRLRGRFGLGMGLSTPQREALEKLNWMLPNKEQFLQDFLAWRRGQLLKLGLGATLGAGIGLGVRGKIAETTIPE